jgi:hypothetical protein
LIGPSLQKKKLWKLPKIKGFILKYKVPPLWPTYICEKKTTFAKTYGLKMKCYWEVIEGTHKKLGNYLL